MGNTGQGQGWPRPAGTRLDGVFDGRGRFGNGYDAGDMTFAVPAEKCGLVIGKGICLLFIVISLLHHNKLVLQIIITERHRHYFRFAHTSIKATTKDYAGSSVFQE